MEGAGHPDLALVALHHDSHEAYLCDVPKLLKRKIAAATDAYDATRDALDFAIEEAFGYGWPETGSPRLTRRSRRPRRRRVSWCATRN